MQRQHFDDMTFCLCDRFSCFRATVDTQSLCTRQIYHFHILRVLFLELPNFIH